MTTVQRAEVQRRASRSLVTLTLLLALTGAAMALITALARWGQAASPWPPVMGTPRGLAVLAGWILLLAALASRRALRLARESADLLRETRRREELVASFDAEARGLARSESRQELCDLVMDSALELVGGDTGSLMLVNAPEKDLVIVAARGLSEDIIRTSRIQFGDRIAGLVAEARRPLLLGPDPTSTLVGSRLERQHQLSSSMCVPLLSDGLAIGVLNVNRPHGRPRFEADDLESVGQLVAKAQALLAAVWLAPASVVAAGMEAP